MKVRTMAVGGREGLRAVVTAARRGEATVLMDGGRCEAIVVPADRSGEWAETAGCLADPKLLERVARAEAEIRRGEGRPLDEVLPPRPRRRQ